MEISGYRSDFLGETHVVDLPTISVEHVADIVTSDELRDGRLIDYLNYSVVMNKSTRQAFYTAGNADFENNTGEGRDFRLDSRIDTDLQLGNIYYKNLDGVENPYDRGHLTRRDAISWGNTSKLANKASRDSCFFTNVSLQHKNFNQDEWFALESAIENSNIASGKRFNVFVGPVFTEIDRFITPVVGLQPGRIPSAFWKVVTYVGNNSNNIQTNAFIVFQDDEAISARGQVLGNNSVDPFDIYQTSTTMIEKLTGIEFSQLMFDQNPMIFFPSAAAARMGIEVPQMHKVTPLEKDHKIIFDQ